MIAVTHHRFLPWRTWSWHAPLTAILFCCAILVGTMGCAATEPFTRVAYHMSNSGEPKNTEGAEDSEGSGEDTTDTSGSGATFGAGTSNKKIERKTIKRKTIKRKALARKAIKRKTIK